MLCTCGIWPVITAQADPDVKGPPCSDNERHVACCGDALGHTPLTGGGGGGGGDVAYPPLGSPD